jgi:ADP-ribose pyrophosphatase
MPKSSQPSKTKSHKTPPSKKQSKARLLSSKVVYRGPAFWVTTDHVQEPHGIRARRDVVHHTGSVVILAVEQRARVPYILLERQYRHAAQQFMWELPAGRIDKREKELPAAKRELLEETGYRALRWKRILKFYASPGFFAETMAIFLAEGLKPGTAHPEADEMIVSRFFSLAAALKMVRNNTIQDAKTISGVLWLADQSRR